MRSIFRLFIYLIVFIFSIMIFLPKESIYNFAEKQLVKNEIIISNEKKEETSFSLLLSDANIYYQGINVANVNKASITSYLFYTKISIKTVKLLDSLESMAPTPINNIELSYSVLDYQKAKIKGSGAFGKISGNIDLINRVAYIELEASKKMKSSYSKILRNMKLKEGRYIYEYRF